MKKLFLKFGFIFLCVGTIIFLLLPFLETPAPVHTDLNAGQGQVVTENPLNVVSKRLAALFNSKKKEKAQKRLSGQNNFTNDSPSVAQNYSPYVPNISKSAVTSPAASQTPSQTVEIPSTNRSFDYEDASFQTDAGEWVLVQQTAPQHSAPGMHEINVHDNPYDRYVRQERARNFGPQTSKQEIPDSKWARLVRPIQTFFGINAPTPVSSSSINVHQSDDKVRSLGTAQNKLSDSKSNKPSTFGQMRVPIPDITPKEWALLTPEERKTYQERESTRNFFDILSGDRTVREAAEILADAKFPNPKSKQEQQKKEDFIQRIIEDTKQRINNRLMANIEANAAGRAPEDELAFMTGCADSSLPVTACEENHQHAPHLPDEILAQESTQNTQIFFEETKFPLPQGLPIAPVIGPTESLDFDGPFLDPDIAEKYRFLAQQKQCDSRTCYWLANSGQSDPKLEDTFKTIGNATVYTDPFNTYDLNEDAYVEHLVQQLGSDTTPEQIKQVEGQARERWKNNRTNWVPCWEEQIVELSQSGNAVIMASDPAVAVDVSKLTGPNIIYTEESLIGSDSPIEQGERITRSIAKEVNDAKEAYREEVQTPYRQAIGSN